MKNTYSHSFFLFFYSERCFCIFFRLSTPMIFCRLNVSEFFSLSDNISAILFINCVLYLKLYEVKLQLLKNKVNMSFIKKNILKTRFLNKIVLCVIWHQNFFFHIYINPLNSKEEILDRLFAKSLQFNIKVKSL